MCGIFGYVGKNNAVAIVIEGLKKLEYRGYDSAGIAGLKDGEIVFCKEVGKISVLEKVLLEKKTVLDLAIAHTRWATHGIPSENNAHPHFDMNRSLALVHNGIIENYAELKAQLSAEGVVFQSDTDTEVIANVIAKYYRGNLPEAVNAALPLLKGAYAIALVHKDHPGKIIAVANQSPIVIGVSQGEVFISSDTHALASGTRDVIFLSDNEIGVISTDKIEIFNCHNEQIEKQTETLKYSGEEVSKGDYEHFTLKEIFEQPQTIRNACSSRLMEEYGTSFFEGLAEHLADLHTVERILILACGTSWHAGFVASYLIEEYARIPVQVEISSEFRYKNAIVAQNTLVIAISQSGETADTIAAVRELKRAKAAKILSISNVQGSTLARESDFTIFLHAGPEIGVCSTKAFTSQLVILSLFALQLARMRHMNIEEGRQFLEALKKIPDQVSSILKQADSIAQIAKKYAQYNNFFFLGRQYMYPTCLEGALKLKEISYINAVGYPAGEMKHGPIALINEECPTVALCTNHKTFDKIVSNLMEVKARKGPILAIIDESQEKVSAIVDDVIRIPQTIDSLAPILTTIVTQLLAYFIAHELGAEIDQPKNLAKSVTVE